MDAEMVQQIVDEVLSSLEPLDTQSAAVVQFLKAKGIASDEELAPYFEQAGNASGVRWLAARVRIKSLISAAMKDYEAKPSETEAKPSETKPEEQQAETKHVKDISKKAEGRGQNDEASSEKRSKELGQAANAAQETTAEGPPTAAEKDEDKKDPKSTEADKSSKEQAA